MMQLSEELTSTENKIAFARQAFNDGVMNYNTKRESFPTNIIAGMFNFNAAEHFEVTNEAEKEAPKSAFSFEGVPLKLPGRFATRLRRCQTLRPLAACGLVDFAQQNLGGSPAAIISAHHKALAGRPAFAALRPLARSGRGLFTESRDSACAESLPFRSRQNTTCFARRADAEGRFVQGNRRSRCTNATGRLPVMEKP